MICYIGAGFTNSYRPKHKFIKSCNFQLTNTYSVDKLAEHTALTAHEIFTVNKNGSGYEIILFPEPCLKLTKNVDKNPNNINIFEIYRHFSSACLGGTTFNHKLLRILIILYLIVLQLYSVGHTPGSGGGWSNKL